MNEKDIHSDICGSTHKNGIDRSNLDESKSPADNFYAYACGGWQEKNPLPDDFSNYGTFTKLSEKTRLQLKDLILNLSDHPDAKTKGTTAQKVADLYSMGMNVDRLNREGAAPLKPMIEEVETLTRNTLWDFIGKMALGSGSPFLGIGVGPDPKDSSINILHVGETGLGLGDRDYYLEDSENNRKILTAYETYVKTIMSLAGFPEEDSERIWKTVIRTETEIARHKKTREERRDPLLSLNMTTFPDLVKNYPGIGWNTYLRQIGVEPPATLNVSSPKFIQFINVFIATLSMREIKDILLYETVFNATGLMSDAFHDADFEMFGKVMNGTKEQQPRWKRAMGIPCSILGESVGALYVEKYFPPENKEYMKRLVENLRIALGSHIRGLEWMSSATKEKALRKLDALNVKIGYPDKWKDYSEISVDPALPYLENVRRASEWFTRDNYSKLGKPVDKTEWFMNPQAVNAYYSPLNNEICFPAGILQPPYFDINADDALNYGAIGVVIGHEMTHGFDDQGRHFDEKGNLSEWWTEEDAKAFNRLADVLVAQFDSVEVAPGVHANGRFTLGENIADQGGLRVALTAYLESLGGHRDETIDGFSPLQRFYLAYAGVWAGNIRPEAVLDRVKTDPHSLGRDRVNETLKNITPFVKAFGIKEGDRMFRPENERVTIW